MATPKFKGIITQHFDGYSVAFEQVNVSWVALLFGGFPSRFSCPGSIGYKELFTDVDEARTYMDNQLARMHFVSREVTP